MEEAPVSALTPDCDPDLSRGTRPVRRSGGVRSTLVLAALVALAVLAVTGDAVPGLVASAAGAVGVVAALALGGRAARLARRAAAAVPLPAARRSRPAA
jgi:hypothetical protein